MRKQPSLQRPLILQPLLLQSAILFISVPIIVGFALRMDSGGPYTDERITPVIAQAIVRDIGGDLDVRMTENLAKLRSDTPDLWFMAEDDAGRTVTFGEVPAQFALLAGSFRQLSYGQLRDRSPPYRLTTVIRRETSPAGPVTIVAHGKVIRLSIVVIVASNIAAIPIFVLLALISLVVTPWIVRRSLAGVWRIAREAEQIDVSQRGRRLSEIHVPKEIAPLVRAVNAALGRLDDGYEQQRRFIASAAHELRTPIAILRMKVEAAPEPGARRLAADVERLANLAEQLLDLQRLDAERADEAIDLVSLARRVAGDLAPLLIASDRTIEVVTQNGLTVVGDAGAIERVVVNLVQNAIEHGGRHVILRVAGHTLEVEDDGPGIPPDERERVFEPFHRLRPRSTGSGLGLHLVQQVVDRHGGRVSLLGAPGGGTIARVEFPEPWAHSARPMFAQS